MQATKQQLFTVCFAVFDLALLWCLWGVSAFVALDSPQWHPRASSLCPYSRATSLAGFLSSWPITGLCRAPSVAALYREAFYTVSFLGALFHGDVGVGPLPVTRSFNTTFGAAMPFGGALRRRLLFFTAF